ncbi:hypothetical protein PM082_016674 [Marasmius tenuissimus]|nr:hypothetical protein PM082_016674 [Marasmius tenuissimus]
MEDSSSQSNLRFTFFGSPSFWASRYEGTNLKFSNRRKWTLVKFNFFFIRYVPLLVQMASYLLRVVGTELTPELHFTNHDCFVWQVCQAVVSLCVVISCDFILLSRIRAFYFHNPHIRNLIYACYSLEIISMIVGLALALPGIRYDENCMAVSVPLGLLVYGGGTIFFQTLLFALTAYKFFKGLREGWGEIPTVSLIMRDGTWAFFLLFGEDPSPILRHQIVADKISFSAILVHPEGLCICWDTLHVDAHPIFVLRLPHPP